MLGSCEGMPKGEKAKMEVLAELMKQMKALMAKGEGDEEIESPAAELAEDVMEGESEGHEIGNSEEMDMMPEPKPKKKAVMMVVASNKKAPPMKGKKSYG